MRASALAGGIWLLAVAASTCAAADGPWRFDPALPPAPPPGMVHVRSGVTILGTSVGVGDETPTRKATLAAFYVDACETTNAEYEAFVKATGRRGPGPAEGDDELGDWARGAVVRGHEAFPVGYVDWKDATAYAAWAGKRLPSEAEWERAARGGDGRTYPWGNTWDPARCNFITDGPTPVGSFAAGVSPFGCYDMSGNVWEWTASHYLQYPGNKQRGNHDYGSQYRVLRGGSWNDHCMYGVRAYARSYGDPENRLPGVGFRCALSAPDLAAYAGVQIPAGVSPVLGRQLMEAIARAVPQWHGQPGGVVIAPGAQGAYQVTLAAAAGQSGPRRLVLRTSPAGVWVAVPGS